MNISHTGINLIRYAVAYVFIISGFLKFVSTDLANQFMSLNLPYPLQTMYFVAFVEVICGFLIAINKRVKIAVIPLIGIMIAAIVLTKLAALQDGFLQFAFNARLDIVMLILLVILYQHFHK